MPVLQLCCKSTNYSRIMQAFCRKLLLNIFKTQKLFTYNFITSILVIPGGNVAGGQS